MYRISEILIATHFREASISHAIIVENYKIATPEILGHRYILLTEQYIMHQGKKADVFCQVPILQNEGAQRRGKIEEKF